MVKIKANDQTVEKVNQSLRDLLKRTKDLRPPFEIIASDFYVSNKPLIFSAKPGKFVDLKPATKKSKKRRLGSEYPVLVDSGDTEKAFTARGSENNITKIDRLKMVLGSDLPYNPYLQEGTKRMPARPPLIIDVGGRLERWLRIINSYAMKGKNG